LFINLLLVSFRTNLPLLPTGRKCELSTPVNQGTSNFPQLQLGLSVVYFVALP